MNRFLTDKYVEDLLTEQQRTLALRDGQEITITHYHCVWDKFDWLLKHSPFDTETIVQSSYRNQKLTGREFRWNMQDIIACMFNNHPYIKYNNKRRKRK